MTDPRTEQKLDATAWAVSGLGTLSVGLGAFQAVVPIVLDRLAGTLDTADDPTRPMREALSSGSALSAWINIAFGIVSVVAGIAVARRVRWAHSGLTVLAWASVVVLLALARPSLAPILVMAKGSAPAHAAVVASAVVMLAAQIVAVVLFLRFWRREEVRSAFR